MIFSQKKNPPYGFSQNVCYDFKQAVTLLLSAWQILLKGQLVLDDSPN